MIVSDYKEAQQVGPASETIAARREPDVRKSEPWFEAVEDVNSSGVKNYQVIGVWVRCFSDYYFDAVDVYIPAGFEGFEKHVDA
jgi:hypothetical protein